MCGARAGTNAPLLGGFKWGLPFAIHLTKYGEMYHRYPNPVFDNHRQATRKDSSGPPKTIKYVCVCIHISNYLVTSMHLYVYVCVCRHQ